MAVELKGTSLEMAFPYNERLVALVKDTQGRKYNPNKKTWLSQLVRLVLS